MSIYWTLLSLFFSSDLIDRGWFSDSLTGKYLLIFELNKSKYLEPISIKEQRSFLDSILGFGAHLQKHYRNVRGYPVLITQTPSVRLNMYCHLLVSSTKSSLNKELFSSTQICEHTYWKDSLLKYTTDLTININVLYVLFIDPPIFKYSFSQIFSKTFWSC